MSNKIKKILLVCIILMTATNAMCCKVKKTITFRAINLYIYDAKTKEPLKGVTVKVSNVVAYDKIYCLYEGEIRYKHYPLENFETNEEGYVQIPMYIYKVKRKYYLYGQNIYINIERIEEELRNDGEAYDMTNFYDRENKHFQRPISNYKGAEIRFIPYQLNEKYLIQLEKSKPYITITFKTYEYSLNNFNCNCETEEFKIYLEHFVEP